MDAPGRVSQSGFPELPDSCRLMPHHTMNAKLKISRHPEQSSVPGWAMENTVRA